MAEPNGPVPEPLTVESSWADDVAGSGEATRPSWADDVASSGEATPSSWADDVAGLGEAKQPETSNKDAWTANGNTGVDSAFQESDVLNDRLTPRPTGTVTPSAKERRSPSPADGGWGNNDDPTLNRIPDKEVLLNQSGNDKEAVPESESKMSRAGPYIEWVGVTYVFPLLASIFQRCCQLFRPGTQQAEPHKQRGTPGGSCKDALRTRRA